MFKQKNKKKKGIYLDHSHEEIYIWYFFQMYGDIITKILKIFSGKPYTVCAMYQAKQWQ